MVTDVVIFDNSFSWARWKCLNYSVELLAQDELTATDILAHGVSVASSKSSESSLRMKHHKPPAVSKNCWDSFYEDDANFI